MNERDRVVLWLVLTALCSVHGYSSNIIKDYPNNKEYLLSASSVVNKFEDNEIRGEFSIYISSEPDKCNGRKKNKVEQQFSFFVRLFKTLQLGYARPKGEISLAVFI